jgi:UDP-N-acetylmuramyl tripeptide synthase
MTDERLAEIEARAKRWETPAVKTDRDIADLIAEVRRLRERVAVLEAATRADRIRKAADSINGRMAALTGRSLFSSSPAIREVEDLRRIADELDALRETIRSLPRSRHWCVNGPNGDGHEVWTIPLDKLDTALADDTSNG